MFAFYFRRLIKLILITVLALHLFACGSATNNDQGVVFNLTGWYTSDLESGLTGVPEPLSVISVEPDNSPTGGAVLATCGFQNNLNGQFLRTDRLHLSYEVPGATQNPPSTVFPMSVQIGPAGEVVESSLPASVFAGENVVYANVSIVPSQVRTWMILNKTLLPEPPFTMIVTARASAVSSGGDRYESNESTIFVEWLTDIDIAPTGTSSDDSDDGTTDTLESDSDSSDEE